MTQAKDLNSSLDIFVIIPAFNEDKTISSVVHEVKRYVDNVIVVDDASFDTTRICARSAGAIVLTHIVNRGQGASLQTGITYALNKGAQILVTFDADGQHDASQIPDMIKSLEDRNVSILLGSRFLNNKTTSIPPLRRFVLKAGIIFTRLFSGIKVTDTHNGFRAFSREAAEKIHIYHDRMAHASEILDEISEHKLSFCEFPVTITYSKYSIKKGQRSLNSIKIALQFLTQKFLF